MKTCVAYGCKQKWGQTAKSSGISFHLFPKNPEKRKAWAKACRRKNWSPASTSFLCSIHFEEKHFDRTSRCIVRLKYDAIPTIFPGFPCKTTTISTSVNCVAFGCTNRYKKGENVHLFSFPHKDKVLLRKWIIAVNRRNWKPKYTSKLCSSHFTSKNFYPHQDTEEPCLKPSAVPTVFLKPVMNMKTWKEKMHQVENRALENQSNCTIEEFRERSETSNDLGSSLDIAANTSLSTVAKNETPDLVDVITCNTDIRCRQVKIRSTIDKEAPSKVLENTYKTLPLNSIVPENVQRLLERSGQSSVPQRLVIKNENGKETVINVVVMPNSDISVTDFTSNALINSANKSLENLVPLNTFIVNEPASVVTNNIDYNYPALPIVGAQTTNSGGKHNKHTQIDSKYTWEHENTKLWERIKKLNQKLESLTQNNRKIYKKIEALKMVIKPKRAKKKRHQQDKTIVDNV